MDTPTNPHNVSLEERRHLGVKAYTVTYDCEESEPTVTDTRTGRTDQRADINSEPGRHSVIFYPWNWGYDSIVSAIVNAHCPRDRMDAVVNNYLLAPTDPDIKAEFDAMQALRAKAKAIASFAVNKVTS